MASRRHASRRMCQLSESRRKRLYKFITYFLCSSLNAGCALESFAAVANISLEKGRSAADSSFPRRRLVVANRSRDTSTVHAAAWRHGLSKTRAWDTMNDVVGGLFALVTLWVIVRIIGGGM